MTRALTGIGKFMTFVERRREDEDKLVPLAALTANESLALTRRVAAGDEEAAAEFFNRYCDRVFRYLLVVSRGKEDQAREALSDAMIKAARHMKPMRSDEDIWRWLTRLAWTSFIDRCRKKERRIVMLSGQGTPEKPAPEPCGELSNALNECLSELSAEERAMVEGFYFDDQSQSELAAEKNFTRKAVESRLARICDQQNGSNGRQEVHFCFLSNAASQFARSGTKSATSFRRLLRFCF
jgi:RNA polymerase sigma factor (sigma-70 family)